MYYFKYVFLFSMCACIYAYSLRVRGRPVAVVEITVGHLISRFQRREQIRLLVIHGMSF